MHIIMHILLFGLICMNAFSVSLQQHRIYSLEEKELNPLFEEFIVEYDKRYVHDEEKFKRYEIFKQNVAKINAMNSDPDETAIFDINQFADLTEEEFLTITSCGFNSSTDNLEDYAPAIVDSQKELPSSFDWRTKNAVTKVKQQGYCGSCWAFGATGAIEGAYGKKHGIAKDFSVSQLVDCDYYNHGCKGGYNRRAIRYLVEVGGQQSEEDYPYVPKTCQCKFDKNKLAVKVKSVIAYDLTKGENYTKKALVEHGPIVIGVDTRAFRFYKGGILKSCKPISNNHEVLLVGYGEDKGQKYYIIKNSWGPKWGQDGYLLVELSDNPCGMYNGGASGAIIE